MKVRELVRLLKKMPQDSIVLFSTDEEGNYYHRKALVERANFSWDDPKVPCDYPEDVKAKMPVVIYPLNGEGDFQ